MPLLDPKARSLYRRLPAPSSRRQSNSLWFQVSSADRTLSASFPRIAREPSYPDVPNFIGRYPRIISATQVTPKKIARSYRLRSIEVCFYFGGGLKQPLASPIPGPLSRSAKWPSVINHISASISLMQPSKTVLALNHAESMLFTPHRLC